MLAQRLPAFMDVDEFYAWDGEYGVQYQLIDGEPVAMAPAGVPHGLIQAQVAFALMKALDRSGSACRVIIAAGVIPHIRSNTNVRIPDLSVSCSIDIDQRAVLDPVLTVEILSPSNSRETWEAIRNYTSIPSMRIILAIGSVHRRIQMLVRDANGDWPKEPAEVPLDRPLDLAPLGIAVDPAEFYRGVPTA